jgi:glycosyltransferase involved in cell wall biosynthesis
VFKPVRLLFNVNVAWFFISHRLEIARAARDSGFEVHISGDVESKEEAELLRREGFAFHHVRLRRGGLSPAYDLEYLRQLLGIMRSVRPQLVHNVTVKPVIYGTVAARILEVPKIVNAVSGLGHAFSGLKRRRLISHVVRAAYKLALGRPDVRVIFQNENDADTLVGAGVIERRQAVLIRGSGVDLKRFAHTPEIPGTPVVVLPARMLRDKGVVEFASAAHMLRLNGHAAEFILAGKIDSANRSSLREADIARLEHETGVRWVGHVSDMATLYGQCHIVCLPSYYGEGLPKSLIEACAAGRAIVTTSVPGCRDAVRHGENGLVVEPRNPEAIAAAIEMLLVDDRLRKKMGMAGRQRAEAEFDIKAVVRATLDVYRSVLA